MRVLSLLLLCLAVACGGNGDGSSKEDGSGGPVNREGLEGERKVSLKEAKKELETSFSQTLNELYVNQSYEVKIKQTQMIYNQETKKNTKCVVDLTEKHTVIEFNETNVEIYVERAGEVPRECQMYFKIGKMIEVHKKAELFNNDFNSKNMEDLVIYRGTKNGQVYFSLSGTVKENGITAKVSGLINPNSSNLYATESLKIRATYKDQLVYEEFSKRKKVSDIDANTINTRDLTRIYVTED